MALDTYVNEQVFMLTEIKSASSEAVYILITCLTLSFAGEGLSSSQ